MSLIKRILIFIARLFSSNDSIAATATISSPTINNKRTKSRGRHLWKTATKCVICGKPLKRGVGQIVFFCSKECRKIGRGDKKVRQRRRKMMEYLKTKNERSQYDASKSEADRRPSSTALLHQE